MSYILFKVIYDLIDFLMILELSDFIKCICKINWKSDLRIHFLHTDLSEITVDKYPVCAQPTYGFLQCANRQGRLFFHFSEVATDADSLRVGGKTG